MLMVEHHMDVVLGLADRVAVLHHGALLAIDTPDAVMADARSRRPTSGSRSDGALEVRDLHVRIGGSHILQGSTFDVRRDRRHRTARAQRRRQDHDAARVMGLVDRDGRVLYDGADIRSADAQDRAARASATCRKIVTCSRPHRRREPAPGRAQRGAALRPRLRPLPGAEDSAARSSPEPSPAGSSRWSRSPARC